MNFELNKSMEIPERTPMVISVLLKDLSDEWIYANEGGDSRNAYRR